MLYQTNADSDNAKETEQQCCIKPIQLRIMEKQKFQEKWIALKQMTQLGCMRLFWLRMNYLVISFRPNMSYN